MKRILPIVFLLTIILSGCNTSKKQLQNGNYDAAISKAVKQLRKDPNDVKQIEILERSYQLANDQDNERVKFLKMEGRPNNWDEIYQIYNSLNNRQSLVKSVTPLNKNGKTIDFPYVDYMADMVAAKRKAADFYYAHGNELMKSGVKESYRQAYDEFVTAREYVGNYEGIDAKIEDAKNLGMSRVFVSIQNNSMIKFPKEFEQDLLALDLPALNSKWVEYYTQNRNEDTKYDFFVDVKIRIVAVSPDQTLQKDTVIKRDVDDGFSYVLDKKGNVTKDTLGNDVKVKKYKTIQCAMIETVQLKACRIDGTVEVIESNPEKLLKKDPIFAESAFNHISSRAIGDIQALNADQLARTRISPIPFPDDIEMVVRCSEALKMAIRGAIQNNKRYIY